MTAPRIGVTGVVQQWDGAERTGVNAAYVRALLAAGGVPVLLSPLVGAEYVAELVDGIDGLVFTGGEDIDPALYHEAPSPLLHAVSRARDSFELALLAAARERGIPILGICRGMQLITVGLGGTLYQDLTSERPSEIDHDAGKTRGEPVHDVRLDPGTRVAGAIGEHTFQVNSLHHQGVKDLPPVLRATAWAEDGLIEAVETEPDAAWLLAEQWHPEEMHANPETPPGAEAPEAGLFRALVREAGRHLGSMNSQIAEQPVR